MKSLWKYDATVLALLAAGIAWNHKVNEEEEARVRAATAAGEAVAAQYAEPRMIRPICPDQWVAQRGANERWKVKCAEVSTEGSRASQ